MPTKSKIVKNKPINYEKLLSAGVKIHANVSQEILSITQDKLKLLLNDYKKEIASSLSFVSYGGILLTIITTLITTDFKNQFGVNATNWRYFYIFIGGVAATKTLSGIGTIIKTLKKGYNPENNIIEKIKNDTIDISVIKKKKTSIPKTATIFIPNGTPKEKLELLSKTLVSNKGTTELIISIGSSSGAVKNIVLPYSVNYTSKIKKEIEKIIPKQDER